MYIIEKAGKSTEFWERLFVSLAKEQEDSMKWSGKEYSLMKTMSLRSSNVLTQLNFQLGTVQENYKSKYVAYAGKNYFVQKVIGFLLKLQPLKK